MKLNYRLLFYSALVIILLATCTTSQPVRKSYFKNFYDFESQFLHPEYKVYHHSSDSSTMYFQIPSSELLYTRANSGSDFEAIIKVKFEIFGDASIPSDSGSVVLSDLRTVRSSGYLRGKLKFKLAQGNYTMVVTMLDEKRAVIEESTISVDKRTTLSDQNFLLTTSPLDDYPLMMPFRSVGDTIFVRSDRNGIRSDSKQKNEAVVTLLLKDEIKLPPPPFSGNNPELPNLSNSSVSALARDEEGNWYTIVNPGVQFITIDSNRQLGVTLISSHSNYPHVEMYDQLIWPLRYITSKAEFEEITKSSFPKQLIDNFWIECGGTKEQAKHLIDVYYSRVQEANRYFSTYTEGWRTDRGMIHLIFGNPSKINRDRNYETWVYGEEGNPSTLVLTFRKVDHVLSDNVFILNRDPFFKQNWEQMVTLWRQGRVYND